MIRKVICVNSVLIIALAACCLVYPPVRAWVSLRDPALEQRGVPKTAWRLASNLTPRYANWAAERAAKGRPEDLSLNNISGTEWPLFGSVFYLWAIENLQAAWDAGDHSSGVEPRTSARAAIIAASELVIDPKHAAWVKTHWGAEYLHRENLFYRTLIIAGLTSRQKLLHDGAHLDLLREQAESLAAELDASPRGLLDDYPGQCFPGDVMAAILSIRRADAVLGTDHSKFAQRAVRAFIGANSTRRRLPPYAANSKSGRPLSDARGCANSYMLQLAPELWPGAARQWFETCDKLFWQERGTIAGYREFAKDSPQGGWMFDVDSGPVAGGFGASACAFGIGAARRNGRFDRAYPLETEMLATIWELPNGVLAGPRLLSNFSDAPLLGEAAILWQLTVQTAPGFASKQGGSAPICVYILLVVPLLFGVWRILESVVTLKQLRRPDPGFIVRSATLQATIWACLMLGALATIWTKFWWLGICMLLPALCLPITAKKQAKDDLDQWGKPAGQAIAPVETPKPESKHSP